MDDLTTKLAEAQPVQDLPPLPALCEQVCAAIKAADDKSVEEAGYMLDSIDCIAIVRKEFARAALAATPAPAPKPCLVTGDCKHGNWCSEVYCQEHCRFVGAATPTPAPLTLPPIPNGWVFNHAQQQRDDDGPVDGVWEIGFLDPEDDRFSPIVTVDTGLYCQDKDAEPLAKAILARLAGQGKEASNG